MLSITAGVYITSDKKRDICHIVYVKVLVWFLKLNFYLLQNYSVLDWFYYIGTIYNMDTDSNQKRCNVRRSVEHI